MDETVEFLVRYGYGIVFAFVFLEQAGLPMPALPFLLAAGALARSGRLELSLIVLSAVAASLIADWIWYEVGRRRGGGVLKWLCRVSLEPDSCVRTTENLFARFGNSALVLAKFVPAFNTAAPPLAGVLGMPRPRFFVLSTASATLWAGLLMGVGYLFNRQVERVLALFGEYGAAALAVALAGLVAYLLLKLVQRRRIMRELRVARISAAELRHRLESAEDTAVIDLRHPMEVRGDVPGIPGALAIRAEEIEERLAEIPRDRELVLVCT